MNKLQLEDYSAIGMIYDELAMALKSGLTTDEIINILTMMFDMGNYEAPEFKNDEVKELSIHNMPINLLAHTSPTMLFGDEQIRNKLSTIFFTSFARRVFYSHPDDDEAVENNPIPETIEERRNLVIARRKQAAELSISVANQATAAISNLLIPGNQLVKFSVEATTLYADYFDYCSQKSELLPDSSILQIEMSGRSWRIGKLAGLWALYSGTNIISKDILASAIYYAEYNSKYLDKFVRLTTSQPFELMAAEFKSGTKYITLHDAITKGYIKRQTTGFKDILEPINSYLRLDGVVTYELESKSFIYEELKFVEDQSTEVDENNSSKTPTRCHFTMSYTILPEGTTKENRIQYLGNFEKYRNDLCFTNLTNLLSKDSVFNPFEFKDAPDKYGNLITKNRNRDNIISSANLIVLDIDDTDIDIHIMHDYLSEIPHLIATTSDSSNLYKYRILLPTNVELPTDYKLFSYITRRVSAELLINPDKVSHTIAQPFYGYSGALVLSNESGKLFDITRFISDFAKNEPIKMNKPPTVYKTEKGRQNAVNAVLDDAARIFSYAIEAPYGEGSLALARASLHMLDLQFNKEEYLMCINFINNQWENPMDAGRLERTIISTYLPRMK